jgi:drug/metabolite transporter (DMT)-like permease
MLASKPVGGRQSVHGMTRTTRLGIFCALTVLVIWSSFILVGRLNATGDRVLLPLDIAFLRFLFSGLGVLAIAGYRARRPSGTQPETSTTSALGRVSPGRAMALGAFAGIGYCSLAYSGFFFAPAAHASVLMTGSLPLWTTVIAFFVLKEPIARVYIAAVFLTLAGDALVGGASLMGAIAGGTAWKGDLCFIGASIMWASYTVCCRKWQVGALDATMAIGLSCLVTFVPVYAIAIIAGWLPTALFQAGWSEILFQIAFQAGLAMLVAGPAYTQVIVSFGAVRAAMVTALVPAISALAAVPVLGEPLSTASLGGLVLVTTGFAISIAARRSSSNG